MTPSTSSRPSSRATTHTGTMSRMRQGHERADDVEPVGGRVEQRAEPAALVQPPGQLAVEPVGEARDHEDDQRPAVLLRPEQQPEEQRDAEQPQHRQGVGQGPDPVGQLLAVAATAAGSRRTGTAADGPVRRRHYSSSPLHTVPEASRRTPRPSPLAGCAASPPDGAAGPRLRRAPPAMAGRRLVAERTAGEAAGPVGHRAQHARDSSAARSRAPRRAPSSGRGPGRPRCR